MIVDNQKYAMDAAACCLRDALECLWTAEAFVKKAFDGYDPGYPSPDTQDARAWDYLDAIHEAERALGDRLNTWDKGDYDE